MAFPGRDDTFEEGFELGLLAASLAGGAREIVMRLGPGSLPQARDLAEGLGYRMVHEEPPVNTATVEVRFLGRTAKPSLRLVR